MVSSTCRILTVFVRKRVVAARPLVNSALSSTTSIEKEKIADHSRFKKQIKGKQNGPKMPLFWTRRVSFSWLKLGKKRNCVFVVFTLRPRCFMDLARFFWCFALFCFFEEDHVSRERNGKWSGLWNSNNKGRTTDKVPRFHCWQKQLPS